MTDPRPTTQSNYQERLLRVLVHIQQHLDDSLPLESLAAIAHFSPFHFHRIFRGMVGEAVKQYIRRLRLERAAMRLCHTEQSVTRVALDAGYEAHEAFTRAFKSAFKTSPSDFREQGRARFQINAPSSAHYQADDKLDTFEPITREDESMKVEIKTIDPVRVAFVRHTGPYDEVGETWGRLCAWAGPRGLLGPDMRMFGASHDDPEVTPPEKIRYDACLAVDEDFEGEGEIGIQILAGGDYAVTLHAGPYQKLGDTYAALFGQWFAPTTHEPGDSPCLEFYLNDPENTPPEDLLTEICVPIAGTRP